MSVKPYVMRTNISQVPPNTPISNIQTAQQIDQYAIRPDRQFYESMSMVDSAAGTAIMTIRGTKNLMITKVFARKGILGAGTRAFRMFLVDAATGSQVGNMMLFLDPGASSTIIRDVCDLSFIPPFYVNLANGAYYLQLDCSGLGAAEFLYVHVYGFFVD